MDTTTFYPAPIVDIHNLLQHSLPLTYVVFPSILSQPASNRFQSKIKQILPSLQKVIIKRRMFIIWLHNCLLIYNYMNIMFLFSCFKKQSLGGIISNSFVFLNHCYSKSFSGIHYSCLYHLTCNLVYIIMITIRANNWFPNFKNYRFEFNKLK